MPHPIEIIKQFAKPDPTLQQRLNALMVTTTFNRRDTITGYNALMTSVYYISSGSARVYYLSGGKEKTFSFAFDDEFIAISRHLIDKHHLTLCIEFLEPTTVITLRPDVIRAVIDNERKAPFIAEGALFINVALHQYAQYLEERLIQFQQASARERYQWTVNRYPRIGSVATGTHLATFLGITRETLYRLQSGTYASR